MNFLWILSLKDILTFDYTKRAMLEKLKDAW